LYLCKNNNLLSIGHSFIELASVDSTNNYAMAQAHAGMATHGTLYFAHEQWAGKGQRGRTWKSRPGENILLSAVLDPVPLILTQPFLLSVAVALACHDFFSAYAGRDETTIKWPNDLYWRDRKAGGLLIENSFQGDRWMFAIAGIGININQVEFPPGTGHPVSLRQITGRSFDALQSGKELGKYLSERYLQLSASGAVQAIGTSPGEVLLAAYNARLYGRGKTVRLKKDNAVFTTVVEGVRSSGELLTRDTLERSFSFGEVEWLIS
jgi:BirA family biotin operon repressor/biotin-[acetyl-CoA-carboxylase] ligase